MYSIKDRHDIDGIHSKTSNSDVESFTVKSQIIKSTYNFSGETDNPDNVMIPRELVNRILEFITNHKVLYSDQELYNELSNYLKN